MSLHITGKEHASGKKSNGREVGCACPFCHGEILAGEKSYFCSNSKNSNCGFFIPKVLLDADISSEDVRDLLRGERITKNLTKNQKSWEQEIAYNTKSRQLDFVQKEIEYLDIKCPRCGKPMQKTSFGYGCSGYKRKGDCSCGFYVPFQFCGKTLTETQMQTLLLVGRTEIINGFVSKKGTHFDARLTLTEDGKIAFVFPKPADATEDVACSYNCPCCGKGLFENNKAIHCLCGFQMKKTACKKRLSEQEIAEILLNGSTAGPVYGMQSKNGKIFHARIALNRKKKTTEFVF